MIERAFVRLDEGQVHLRIAEAEAPTAPPIILLHASPSSSRWMVPLMEALAGNGRTVIAPDTLGNGDSPPPTGEAPDIAYFADSVIRLADAMGIDRFDVYGAHTGARIACELAAAYPTRVRATVLDGIKEYDDATREKILAHYAPKVPVDAHGTHMIWAFNFVRDQALYFPHFEQNAEHRLPGHMPSAQILHDATLDVLKALDTYPLPYLAAFRYRPLARLPAIATPVLLLKSALELAVLNAAIDEAAALLRHGQVAAVASDPASKAAAMLHFFDALA
jgi:pimeloyl-ACP methyl ester carboxylesterase